MKKRLAHNLFFHIFVLTSIICFLVSSYLQDTHTERAYHFKSSLVKVDVPFDVIIDGKTLDNFKLKDKSLILDKKANEISFKFKLPYYEELEGFIPFLFFKAANFEVSVFCDDELIFSRRYQTDYLNAAQTYEGVAINFIELPSDYVDKEITIALKNHLQAFDKYNFQTIYIGNETAVILHALSYGFPGFFFGVTTLLVGGMVLLLIFITRKSKNFNLISIALFIINLGVWLSSQSHAKFLFCDNSAAVVAASYLALFSLPPLTIYVLNSYYIFEKKCFYKVLENISLYGLIVVGIFYLLADLTPFSMKNALIFFGAYALLFELTITFYLIYLAFHNQNKMLKNPIIALLFILFAIILDETLLVESKKLSTLGSFFILYCPYLIASFFLIRDVMKIYINEAKTATTKKLLYQIYSTDSQTGAITRSCFEDNLTSKKHKVRPHSVVYFIDIDNMKKINDREGHIVGDLLIESMGKAVKALFEEQPSKDHFFVKYGGDEFLIILPPTLDFDINQFKKRIEEKFMHYCINKTTLSIGYATVEDRGVEVAIKEADEMMLKAKAIKKHFGLEDL